LDKREDEEEKAKKNYITLLRNTRQKKERKDIIDLNFGCYSCL